jgi:hypothetical protein
LIWYTGNDRWVDNTGRISSSGQAGLWIIRVEENALTLTMSNVNFNVLFQSVENLSVQHEKKIAETDNDQVALRRATALLEGLSGMIGIENMNIHTNASMLCLSTMIDGYDVQLSLDPSCDLKLRGIQVRSPPLSSSKPPLPSLPFQPPYLTAGCAEWNSD